MHEHGNNLRQEHYRCEACPCLHREDIGCTKLIAQQLTSSTLNRPLRKNSRQTVIELATEEHTADVTSPLSQLLSWDEPYITFHLNQKRAYVRDIGSPHGGQEGRKEGMRHS